MEKIAVIGAGLVGRAWAIVFARAGREVALYDSDPGAVARAQPMIVSGARDLADAGLIDEAPETVGRRVRPAETIAAALDGAVYAQENTPEDVAIKREVFAAMDEAASADAVLGSSTSGIRASLFSEHLKGRHRCLVAHPVNPPSVVPLVELAPAPWTDTAAVAKARALMTDVGQEPITVLKEMDGFILNRLQGALLNEAMRLIADGCVTTEDLDKTVRHGLGLRWSFMGPMETIDLNAPEGLPDYASRYGPIYYKVGQDAEPRPWDEALFGRAASDRRAILPLEKLAQRQAWRDRRLMALAAHKRKADKEIGD